MTSVASCGFSQLGGYFGAVTHDGHAKVWDTGNNTLHATRPADLSDPARCLAWETSAAPEGKQSGKRQKKVAQGDSKHVLLGTQSGKVVLFNISDAKSYTMRDHHTAKVNAAVWGKDTSTAFSCSDDHHILQWDLTTRKQCKKWKAGDAAVTALCFGTRQDGIDVLVSAALQIKVWDVTTGAELQCLRGHATAIGSLLFCNAQSVFSCSHNDIDDPLIYSWSPSSGSTEPKFILSPEAAPNVIGATSLGDDKWRLASVTAEGVVQVFDSAECVQEVAKKQGAKSRKVKKAVKLVGPSSTIKMSTGDAPSAIVPILHATFKTAQQSTHLLVARGSYVAPIFENLACVSENDGELIDLDLTRESPGSYLLRQQSGVTKSSATSADVTHLSEADSLRLHSTKRRKNQQAASAEPSLAERVKELGLAKNETQGAKSGRGRPQAGSLAHMLAQALHSNDQQLFEDCLNTTDAAVVRNTITRLPAPLAVRFLIDIVARLEAKPSRGVQLLVWIRAVLLIHSSSLMTVPDLPNILSGLYSLVDARVAVFPRLLKLSGRLDLLLSQIALKSQSAAEIDAADLQIPLTSYVDEDSDNDDGDDEEGMKFDGEDSDDWDTEDEEEDGDMDADKDGDEDEDDEDENDE